MTIQKSPNEMTAAVLAGPGRVNLETMPKPKLSESDVWVEVDLCGICGSDLHLILEGWAAPGSWQGHEWVGTVVEVGSGVTEFLPGDRVVGGPVASCGLCTHCKSARPSLCDKRGAADMDSMRGAFATYKLTKSQHLLPLPAGVDERAAALTEPLAVALHALSQGRVTRDSRVLVLGGGPIGALAIAAMAYMGVKSIVCAEPNEIRRKLALAVGAHRVIDPSQLVVPSFAEPDRVVEDAVDVVLECSGKATAMEAGLAQLVRGGTLVLVGAGIETPKLNPNRILLNELVITGAYNHDEGGFLKALELLHSGCLPVEQLLEPGTVPLESLIEVMRDLASGQIAGKVLVQP